MRKILKHFQKANDSPRHLTYRLFLFLWAVLPAFFPTSVIYGSENPLLELETEGIYHIQPGVSDHLAEQIALYEGKRNAVDLAARYLARQNFIETYDRDRGEIFSLAARKIKAKILEKKKKPGKNGTVLFIRIRATVQSSDFVAAEILDEKLEKEDEEKSFLQEMEPSLSNIIDPGKDIAEAYRLVYNQKWRMALIYLDKLEEKYPGWSEIFMVKALGYYASDDTADFIASLKKACRLGNNHACQELKSFKKIHNRALHHR